MLYNFIFIAYLTLPSTVIQNKQLSHLWPKAAFCLAQAEYFCSLNVELFWRGVSKHHTFQFAQYTFPTEPLNKTLRRIVSVYQPNTTA